MKENYPIDFVVMWVDGNDPEWQNDFKKYYKNEKGLDASFSRVRDWDNLKYLLRSIEKFAPWYRTLHFVTYGHLPKWLNTNAPKLHIANHKDFLPAEYFPTFSSFPTSINLHRIEGIAEHFVSFDDDMFLSQKVIPTRFFKKGLPVDCSQLTVIPITQPFSHYTLNIMSVIKKRYNIQKQMKTNFGKWFNPKYGLKTVLKTAYLFPWANNCQLKNPHVPIPYLKSTFEKIWSEEYEILDATARSKFRSIADVNAWIMRYEQLASGNFYPNGYSDTHTDMITDSNAEQIAHYITKQKYTLFCINDNNDIADFEKTKSIINSALEKILPEKSSFEL